MDPHIKSWGGTWFDYHGECDLVFIHAPEFVPGVDLDIHVRTTIRYDYSYISSAALRIGNDTLEVASYGEWAVNKVEMASLDEVSIAGYHVKHTVINKKNSKFEIKVDGHTITISTFKDMVSIRFNDILMMHVEDSVGILGHVNGKLLGRDGITEFTDMNAFGQEWQVLADEPMLFRQVRAPQAQAGEQCRLPQISSAEKSRRLGEYMARETAEAACARFTGQRLKNCISDVLATGDVDVADAF